MDTIDVSPNLKFAIGNASYGVRLTITHPGVDLSWTVSPEIALKLAEALTDAVTIRKLQARRR